MSDVPLSLLFGGLLFCIILSAFFSGSETGMMALNRYRLRHLAKHGHRGAKLAARLLERPDRLIGLILLGNNFVNIVASSLATLIGLRLWGEGGIAAAAALLTLAILVFAEVAPKTLAALNPERVAFAVAYPLVPLLSMLYPLVWLVNGMANGLLRMFGMTTGESASHVLSREELRTVVNEAGAMIPRRHRQMLVSILDLENVTVDDIMVPRSEIQGIDLSDEWDDIVRQLTESEYTRLPVYQEDIDRVQGVVHVRNVLRLVTRDDFNRDALLRAAREPYYIPEGTPLHTQLLNFQRQKRSVGLVVDEYGDIRGLVTLEDILEEIVGEFTTEPAGGMQDVYPEQDGSFLVDGSATIRDLNRMMHWELPTDGPKTLNGLILEHMETIPEVGTSFLLAGYPVEVVQTSASAVKTVRIKPALRRKTGGS